MKQKSKIIFKFVLPVLSIVLIYGAINLVSVGAQKFANRDDQKKLDAMTAAVESEEKSLQGFSNEIDAQEVKLDALDAKLTAMESNADNATYNAEVDAYNALYEAYDANINSYNSRTDGYNGKVDQANELAKSVGSTWYIVPIPTGTR